MYYENESDSLPRSFHYPAPQKLFGAGDYNVMRLRLRPYNDIYLANIALSL